MAEFDSLKIRIDEYLEDNQSELIKSFRESSNFEVIEHDNAYAISWDGHDSFGIMQTNPIKSFQYTVNQENLFEEFVDEIQDKVGSYKIEESGSLIHMYSRKLKIDESNCDEFVSKLVDKVESLGYSVKHERSSGMFFGPETTHKELKWWFYVREEGEVAPHGVALHFAEDGIYMRGSVTAGKENEEEFRQILSEFSI
jgi:hypothetical protein